MQDFGEVKKIDIAGWMQTYLEFVGDIYYINILDTWRSGTKKKLSQEIEREQSSSLVQVCGCLVVHNCLKFHHTKKQGHDYLLWTLQDFWVKVLKMSVWFLIWWIFYS